MTDPSEVHVPVLAAEVLRLLGGGRWDATTRGWTVDATLGAGGHSALLLGRFPCLRVLGSDQDDSILALAGERLGPFQDRVRIVRSRISELGDVVAGLDERPIGWLMDVGASSLQLDRAERGFSFQWDGPLDMRMDTRREVTAADIVNGWAEADLADLFFHEGGERASRRVARAICEARRRVPFLRTRALADLIAHELGRSGPTHPATKVFQALRRAVNAEDDELRAGLALAEEHLADDGVLCVISFHSGEDAVVKRFLADRARAGAFELLTKAPLEATHEELRANPRARSAKARAARRIRPAGEPRSTGELQ
ncbi:MAG: 16S rRNA (cytosine(1402)-N(4))-methyltransferase RsmH [Planctomycetota bacterium]